MRIKAPGLTGHALAHTHTQGPAPIQRMGAGPFACRVKGAVQDQSAASTLSSVFSCMVGAPSWYSSLRLWPFIMQ